MEKKTHTERIVYLLFVLKKMVDHGGDDDDDGSEDNGDGSHGDDRNTKHIEIKCSREEKIKK